MPTKIKGLTGVDKVEAGAVITNPSFSGNATVTGSLTVGGVNVFSGPYRNLIINGDMSIAQRGTSVAGISSGGTYHTIDRFVTVLGSAGTWTQTQDNDVPTGQGFAKSLKMQCTTANASLASGAYNSIQHFIEAQNLQHLKYGTSSAESVTLSFWVKSNKTGTYVAQFLQPDSSLRTIVKSYTISNANTWEKKTITIEGDTAGVINNDNGSGLEVRFALAYGSTYTTGTLQTTWGALTLSDFAVGQVNLADSTSNYINITGVQLEVGEGASDFEFLPYDVQLARCQRYYEKYSFILSSGGGAGWRFNVDYKVTKRATPNASYDAIKVFDGAWRTPTLAAFHRVGVQSATTNIGYSSSFFYIGNDGSLDGFESGMITLDAEL